MKLTIFLQINGFKTKNSEFKFNMQKNIDKLYFFKNALLCIFANAK